MLIKMCGLSNVIDAEAAVEAGATGLGFVMGGKVLPCEVEPHAQMVREIIKKIPASVDTFIVTHLLEAEGILALAEYAQSSGIQISEPIDVSVVKKVREGTSRKIIKTVTVRGEKSFEDLKKYSPYADFILLDTQVAGYVGGTGVTSDWSLCQKLIEASLNPVYLAGGLTPENVEDAIEKTRPAGVDVSTGISTYSEGYLRKDRKSLEKMKNFVISTHRAANFHV